MKRFIHTRTRAVPRPNYSPFLITSAAHAVLGLALLMLTDPVFAIENTNTPNNPKQKRPSQEHTAIFTSSTPPQTNSVIDQIVLSHLAKLGITPANLCPDAVFIRRVYLDLTGTIPTPVEARNFLQDPSPNKRAQLIEKLLNSEAFVDYQTMKWADLLRIKAEYPINLWPNAAQAYYNWVRSAIRQNLPYDRFARELLTASGSNFRVPPANFYRAVQNRTPKGIASTVALTFMGVRTEYWPEEKLDGLAKFFSQIGFKTTKEWKEEIVYWKRPTTNTPFVGTLPDGTTVEVPCDLDPRIIFTDWLVSPNNPWFAKNIVNRIWAWLFGRGIIHEPDDIRPDNPPSIPALLAYLENQLIQAHYDLKHIYRIILNSHIYQLSCIPPEDTPRAATNFACYLPRRLEAEVIIDAINQITSSSEKYVSPIPEPFTVIPEGYKAVKLGDASITSPFLELFGRPPRDTGLESERNNRITAAQRLHLLNSTHIHKKLEQSPLLRELSRRRTQPAEAIRHLYLTILSRYPSPQEMQIASEYIRTSPNYTQALLDLAWALVNSAEFIYKH